MKTCPVCAREFPDNVKFCPNDGQTLRAKGPTADLVGQVVADRYHIIKKLGEGGMGAVYLGEHVKMGRKSAIKVMTQAMSNDPDAVSRFNREAANAARLSHPNICQVYDFGETSDGLIYLAMEFIEGRSLNSILDESGTLPIPRAASIITQCADALQVAHDLGIVHRDLKPDNIMVITARGRDTVKVVDFGIAKAVGAEGGAQKVTKTGFVVGTPEYMSPEQVEGKAVDARSDVFSLGAVLYELLTGRPPFRAATPLDTLMQVVDADPVPPRLLNPSVPRDLETICLKCLQKAPALRYPSARELASDLNRFLQNEPIYASSINLLERMTRAFTLSARYTPRASRIWRRLLAQAMRWAEPFARLSAGSSMAARMAMIAMTTSSSMSVNPPRGRPRKPFARASSARVHRNIFEGAFSISILISCAAGRLPGPVSPATGSS